MSVNNNLKIKYTGHVLANNLRIFRTCLGKTEETMADILGISEQEWKDYEIDAGNFPMEYIYKCSKEFNMPYSSFFHGMDGAEHNYFINECVGLLGLVLCKKKQREVMKSLQIMIVPDYLAEGKNNSELKRIY